MIATICHSLAVGINCGCIINFHIQIVANFGSGYDALDIDKLAKQGIQVSNTPDVLSDCVADFTMMLLLASARNMKYGKCLH